MREETFTIQFYNQDSFEEFWNKYSPSILPEGDRSKFFMTNAGRGNVFSERDNYQKLLGLLYDSLGADCAHFSNPHKTKVLDIVENVLENGDANETVNKFGGKQELDRLEKLI